MPHVHYELGGPFSIQFGAGAGAGAGFDDTDWLAGVRLVYELD